MAFGLCSTFSKKTLSAYQYFEVITYEFMLDKSAMSVGKVLTPSEIESLAIERLNEDPKRRNNDVKAIKDWMSKQPHLKENGRNGKTRLIT